MPIWGTVKSLVVFTVFVLSFVSIAHSQCQEPAAPKFPGVEQVDFAAMEHAQADMQQYISAIENYLDCLGPVQSKQHIDHVLATMKQVSSEYNALVAADRKRKAQQLFSGGNH